MRPIAQKLLTLYLAFSVAFSPVAPALAYGQSTSTVQQQNLPELGSAAIGQSQGADLPARDTSSEWLSQAATHDDLAPSVLQNRTQGIEQAVAQGVGILSGAVSDASRNWFSLHNITSELTLNAGHGGIRGGALDLLLPLYDQDKSLFFVQAGARRMDTYTEDYRNTLNLGMGYRRDVQGWLLGGNSFYDRDLTGKNDRLGVGVEAWRDFLKLSANSYLPLSKWKASPDQIDYLERPAKGWDVRAEGYLPAYPQLGAKLGFEQYYGNEVSLFSANDRQKDPRALTVGVMYNPIPMVGLSVNHRMGQGGLADTSATLSFNYRIGEPLAKQLSGDNLMSRRMLENMRYDLVQRNNEIVLDRKDDAIRMTLPAVISDTEYKTVSFAVTGASRLQTITWAGTAAGFASPYQGNGQGALQMPAYVPDGDNTYSLQAVGTDKNGRVVTSSTMSVVVHALAFTMVATPAKIVANGISTSTLKAKIMDTQSRTRSAGVPVTWTTTSGSLSSDTTTTDHNGEASVVLTSHTGVDIAMVEATASATKRSASVHFMAGPASMLAVTATPDSIEANGVSTSTLSATVKDAHGNLVHEGVSVSWTTSAGELDVPSSTTDSNGVATAVLTSSQKAGAVTVEASAGDARNTVAITFTAGAPAPGNNGLSLVATPTSVEANGTSASRLNATVKDTYGNLVGAGVAVNWSTTAGVLDVTSSTTNASGAASAVLTSSIVAGAVTVKAVAGAAHETAELTFTPGAPGAGSDGLTLVATPDSLEANGSTTSTLNAQVKDANGNPVGAGVTVTWATTDGTLVNSTSTTDASGKASTVLTSSQKAGAVTVEAAAGAARNTAALTFTAGAPAPGNSGLTLVATPDAIEADGLSTSTLSATVRDVYGNLVGAGVAVSWSSSDGVLNGSTSTTNASGVASAVLTSSKVAGAVIVEAQAGRAQNAVALTFTPGAPAPGNSGLTLVATPASLEANGSSTSTLTAVVRDANGNSVNAGVVVNWTTSDGTLASATSMTDAAGKASMVLTSSQKAGAVTVEAVAGAAHDSAALTFIPGAPAPGNNGLTLLAAPASIEANGSSTSTLTATLKDAYGNPVDAGVVVTWTTTDGTLANTTSTTDATGKASMLLTSSKKAGSVSVEAVAGAARDSVALTFTPGAPAPGNNGLSLVATPASIEANGSSTSNLTAMVRDANGNSVGAGVAVTWTTTDGTLANTTSMTDTLGAASMVLTSSTVAGAVTVEAQAGAAKNSAAVTFTPGAPATGNSGLTVLATPDSIEADGSSTSTLTAVVKDANGNTVGAGVAVSWNTTRGTLDKTLTTTNAGGVATAVLTSSTVAGAVTVEAQAGAAKNSAAVAFTPGVPAMGNHGLTLAATPDAIEADGSSTSTLTAMVKDANGNPVGAGVAVSWTTSDGTLANTTSMTDALGAASMVLTSSQVAGAVTVTAAAGAAKNSAVVTFTPGAPAAGNNGLSLVATPDVIEANGSSTSTLTALVKDANGNAVGAGVAVTWTTTDGTLANTTSMTDAFGAASMVLTSSKVAGAVTVEALAGAAHDKVTVTFAAGAPALGNDGLTLVATPSSIVADGSSTSTLSATVRDAYGNAVGAGVSVNWTTSTGTLDNVSSTTNASGVATAVLTSSKVAGAVTVEAVAGKATNSALVTFTAGAPAAGNNGLTLVATPASIEASGSSTSNLTATVRDANGNSVGAGVAVTWKTTDGTLANPTSMTDAFGAASMVLTSSTVAGAVTVEALAGAAHDTAVVTFTAGAPAAGNNGLTLAATPDAIEANGSSTSTLTAVVKDANGNTVGAGVAVTWKTTDGSLSNPTSMTDAFGAASVVLTSSTAAGAVTVEAAAGAAKNSALVTFTAGAPAAGNNGLTLVATPDVIEADGISTSTLSAAIKDAHGNPVGAGVSVTWTTSAGALDNSVSTTNASGVATAVLTSVKVAATVTVEAVAGAAHDTAAVTFAAGAPAVGSNGLSLVASPNSIEANGSSTSTLTAMVRDANGNSVGAGVAVTWKTTDGSLSNPTSMTDAFGAASVVLTSSKAAGSVTVEAAAGAANDKAVVTFTAGAPAAGSNGLSLAATPASIEANGSSASTLTAAIKDANGNAVGAGVVVSWATTGGTLDVLSSVTNSNGVASAVLTSSKTAGAVTVEAAAGAAHDTTLVTFAAGAPAAGSNGLTLVATPDSIEANGSSTSNLTAMVKDANGNSVGTGVVVTWTTTDGTLANTTSMTDAFGAASMVLTSSTVAGAVTVEAAAGAARDTAVVAFTAGAPAAGNNGLTLVATPDAIEADGVSVSTLTATVKDANGNSVGTGVVVTWTTTAGSLANPTSMTDASGAASMVLTSSKVAGAVTVEAAAGSAKNSALVTFTAGAPAAGNNGLTLVATPDSIEANGSSTSTLTAMVKDANGNSVGTGVVVTWTTTDGTLANTTSMTDAFGAASMVLTSSTVAGAVTVEAAAGAARDTAVVAFTAGAPAAGNNGLTLVATPDSIEANGSSTSTLTAMVKDANGNSVGTGVVVTWTTTDGTLANTTSMTDAFGAASMVLTSSTVAGAVTVEAIAGAAQDVATVTFTAGAPAPGNNGLTLVATPDVIEANGVSTSTLSAAVKDAHGNPVGAGVSVNWTSSVGTLDNSVATTNVNGVATAVLTSAKVAGAATIEAVAGAAQATAVVTFSAGAPAAGSNGLTLVATPDSIEANGSSTSTLTAAVKDANGNAVGAGVTVTWTTTSGTLANPTSTTDASGFASVLLTSSTVAGAVTVGAVAGAAYNSAALSFTPGVPAAGDNGLALVATPDSIEADGVSTSTLHATVKDAHGNPVGAGITVNWTTSAGTLDVVSSTTNTNGVASAVLTSSTIAGAVTVEATAGAAVNSALVTFTAGAPAAGDNGLTLVATPDSIEANGSSTSTLTAMVKDANGNSVGAGVAVTWKTTDGSLASTTSMTNASGAASMVLTSSTAAGAVTVEALAGAAHDTAVVTFTAGAPAAGSNGLSLVAAPDSIEANGSSTSTLTAVVKDANGNSVGAGIAVTWKTSAGTLANTTSTTDASGAASMVLTSSTVAGAVTVEAAAGAAKNSALVTFTAGAPAVGNNGLTLVATPASIVADGTSTSTLKAMVKDANGNAVGVGVAVTWKTTGGALASTTSMTDASGAASMVLTSAKTVGAVTVEAVSGAAQHEAVVTFIAGAPAPGNNGLSLVATPASIEANGTSVSTLTAMVKDAHGNSVGAGIAVTWKTTDGSLANTTSTTDGFGAASMVLTSSTVAGAVTVEAAAGAANDKAVVTFTAGAPAAGSNGLTLVATPASIVADGTSTSTLTAVVKDANGNPVGAGIAVTWKTTDGSLANTTSMTDASGAASMVLTSSEKIGAVTVEALAGVAHASVALAFTARPPAPGNAGLKLVATPSAIEADGSSTSTLTAMVKDAKGNSVGADVAVTWTTTEGTLASTTSMTDAFGAASMVLTSSKVAGAVTVEAVAGAARDTATVIFTEGPPATITLVPTPDSIEAGGVSTSTLRATVKDAYGNLLSGVTVNWTTSAGSLDNTSSTTNASGIATAVLTSATETGRAVVDASVGTLTASTGVDFFTGPPGIIKVTASPGKITADGSSRATVSAALTDGHLNPVGAGVTITWDVVSNKAGATGTLSRVSSTTDANGIATVDLTSTIFEGVNTVTASVGSISASTTVEFDVIITITATSTVYGNGTGTFSVRVTDVDGAPLSGTVVYLSQTAGKLYLDSTILTLDSNGRASTTMRNPVSMGGGGTKTIYANVGGFISDGDHVNIRFH